MRKNSGSVLVIVVVIVAIIAVAVFALFRVRAAGPGAAGATGPKFTWSAAFVRTPTGVSATVTVVNTGTEDLKNLRVLRASVPSMTGVNALPVVLGTVPRGATSAITLPFTGPVPAANAPLQIEVEHDYKFGMFGNGSGSSSMTAIVP